MIHKSAIDPEAVTQVVNTSLLHLTSYGVLKILSTALA